ncbi:DUF1822 family protein [Acaryochloris marina NIES-2412]|uniref:DUF1822 family protein n=1 Tax=Acaryochloris marina TaxID=155978 RepID=UPI0040581E61
MFSTQNPSTPVSLLSPTVFDLEDHIYRQAQQLSADRSGDEQIQWQQYLSALGMLALTAWLEEMGLQPLRQEESHILQLGEFRLRLLVVEHCLSEAVNFPKATIEDPSQASHFYLLLEVVEDVDEVWFRGFVRHDQLCQIVAADTPTVTVPLDFLETEPSRLLHYCRYLDPQAIPLPQAAAASEPTALEVARTQLSQWFDNLVTEGWQTWESLQPQLAYATRGLADGLKRGKLVNLGLRVGEEPVALVLTLTPGDDEKVSILIQVLPTGSSLTLPSQLELCLRSKKGKVLQQVISRSRDNYIQLKAFRGSPGQRFSVTVALEEGSVTEDFEI